MKRLILTVMLLVALVGVTAPAALAYTVEDACSTAAEYNWKAEWANINCIFAMMAEIGGTGPDGMW